MNAPDDTPDRSPARRAADGGLLAAVTLVLALPFADWALDLQPGPRQWERRPLALAPAPPASAAAAAAWPREAERWVDDHVGLRRGFIQWWNLTNLALLGYSPVEHVLVGDDGWLYEGNPHARACYRGDPLPPELRDGWRHALTRRRDWCRRRGMRYAVVVVPMKAAIHGEAFPGTVAAQGAGQQLLRALDGVPELTVVDAAAALRAQRARAELFHRRDHHWNARGVHVVLDALAGATGAAPLGRPPYGSVRFEPSVQPFEGDLARQLALEGVWAERPPVVAAPVPEIPRWVGPGRTLPARAAVTETDDAGRPHVVVLGDSYTIELRRHLAPRCRRLVALRVAADRPAAWGGGGWLEQERPEWVVDVVRASTVWMPPEAPGR